MIIAYENFLFSQTKRHDIILIKQKTIDVSRYVVFNGSNDEKQVSFYVQVFSLSDRWIKGFMALLLLHFKFWMSTPL